MKTHVFWLVLIIICCFAVVAAFFYNKKLEATLGGRNQGIVWIFICVAFVVSIMYFSKT